MAAFFPTPFSIHLLQQLFSYVIQRYFFTHLTVLAHLLQTYSFSLMILITQFNGTYLTYFNSAFLCTSMVCNLPTSIVPQLPAFKVLGPPKI
jgi:hypothetical protein